MLPNLQTQGSARCQHSRPSRGLRHLLLIQTVQFLAKDPKKKKALVGYRGDCCARLPNAMLTLLMLLFFEVLSWVETLMLPYHGKQGGNQWWSHIMHVVAFVQPWHAVLGDQGSAGAVEGCCSCSQAAKACAHCMLSFLMGPGIMPRSSTMSSAIPRAIPPFEDWHSEQRGQDSCRGLGQGHAHLQFHSARFSSTAQFWPQ